MTGENSPVQSPWQKSSASEHSLCVEVQFSRSTVRVRNSHRPDQTVEFTADEWNAFIIGVHAGEFDRQPSSTAP